MRISAAPSASSTASRSAGPGGSSYARRSSRSASSGAPSAARAFPGAAQDPRRRGVARGLGLEQVRRDHLLAFAVGLEDLGGPAVQPRAAGRPHVGGDRLAHHRVDERQALGGEQLDADEVVDHLLDDLDRQLAQPGDAVGARVIAEHRQRVRDPQRVLALAVQAGRDGAHERAGHGAAGRLRVGVGAGDALGAHGAAELADQHRIAAGGLQRRGDEAGFGLDAERVLEQAADRMRRSAARA